MKNKVLALTLILAALLVFLPSLQAAGPLEQITIYKGEKAGPGTGMISFKLAVGEEIIVTAKGVDKDGLEVSIWPTWKADPELSIKPVEGRSLSAVVKALEATSAPLFFSAVYKTDDGKKVVGEVMGQVK